MSENLFQRLVAVLLRKEGGHVNHPDDKGGETNFGITVAVARENGYHGPMRDMPRSVAVDIYRRRYWTRPGFDKVAAISEAIAEELWDTGVNMGPAVATMFLQRVLNALNRQGRDYPDITVDGEMGPRTRAALAAYLKLRRADGETVLLRALNCLQGERYIALAEKRAENESFLHGWLLHRVA